MTDALAERIAAGPWRATWHPLDPDRPCYTCGARPTHRASDGSPMYRCHVSPAVPHVPIEALPEEVARWHAEEPRWLNGDKRKRVPWSNSGEAWMERDDDRERQRVVALRIERHFPWRLHEKPPAALYDFDARSGSRLVAAVEVKSRNIGWGEYPDIILSKPRKVDRMMRLAVPAYVFIHTQQDDRLHHVLLTKALVRSLRTSEGGRKPRPGSVHDIELVYHFPLDVFTEVT